MAPTSRESQRRRGHAHASGSNSAQAPSSPSKKLSVQCSMLPYVYYPL
jgi:hypothetical protein